MKHDEGVADSLSLDPHQIFRDQILIVPSVFREHDEHELLLLLRFLCKGHNRQRVFFVVTPKAILKAAIDGKRLPHMCGPRCIVAYLQGHSVVQIMVGRMERVAGLVFKPEVLKHAGVVGPVKAGGFGQVGALGAVGVEVPSSGCDTVDADVP